MKDPNQNMVEIERYLSGEMSVAEKKAFEQRLKENKSLMQEWNHIQTLKAGMRVSVLGDKLKMLKDIENQSDFAKPTSDEERRDDETDSTSLRFSRKRSKIKNQKSKILRWVAAAAAVMVLVAVMIWPEEEVRGPSAEYAYLFEEGEFEKTIEHTLYRSVSRHNELSDDQIYAYNLYVDQQFEKAIPELKKLWENQQDSLAWKYLGYSYLGIGENVNGKEILKNFPDNEVFQ